MRYVSTFSGVEAATLAWRPLGWEAMAFAEVDPFPCAVLAERFPEVPNLGDVSKVDWEEFRRVRGRPDVVVGGSPCQSFSVAGKREGLEGASGLMWEFVRACDQLRPRWVVWENVPGALSSSGGEDFRCLLQALDELGYCSAWRVLDAQFFGVAQRRRRVFLVASLGSGRAAEVLLEPEGMLGDPPSSREKRQALAARAGAGAGSAGGALSAGFGYKVSQGAGSIGYEVENAPTLLAGRNDAAVLQIQGSAIGRAPGNGPGGPGWCDPEENGAYTLDCADRHAVAFAVRMREGSDGGGKGPLVQEDVSGTLSTRNDQALFEPVAFAANQRGEVRLEGGDGAVVGAIPASRSGKQVQGVVCQYGEVAGALTARGDSSPCSDRGPSVVSDGYAVRRLTPRECERLQGMPDDWTCVPYRGMPAEECPDTPRYKAIGNSMAVPVMRWIGERVEMAERGELDGQLDGSDEEVCGWAK